MPRCVIRQHRSPASRNDLVLNDQPAQEAVAHIARASCGRLVAWLAARSGDIATAEDALAEERDQEPATFPDDRLKLLFVCAHPAIGPGLHTKLMLQTVLGLDAATLAATHAFGIAKNPPFADGNKRTAWVVARLFLMLNGVRLVFELADAIATMEGLAAGRLDEAALTAWFRTPIGPA
jgi:hypothetical protein